MGNTRPGCKICKINTAAIIVTVEAIFNAIVTLLGKDSMRFNYICFGVIICIMIYQVAKALVSDSKLYDAMKIVAIMILLTLLHVTSIQLVKYIIFAVMCGYYLVVPIVMILGNIYYLYHLMKKHTDHMLVFMMLTCDAFVMNKDSDDGVASQMINTILDGAIDKAYREQKEELYNRYHQQLERGSKLFQFDSEDIACALSSFDDICETIKQNVIEVYEDKKREDEK